MLFILKVLRSIRRSVSAFFKVVLLTRMACLHSGLRILSVMLHILSIIVLAILLLLLVSTGKDMALRCQKVAGLKNRYIPFNIFSRSVMLFTRTDRCEGLTTFSDSSWSIILLALAKPIPSTL